MQPSKDSLDRFDAAYEAAEAEFLHLARSRADRKQLHEGALAVAVAAEAYNAEAYAQFHRSQAGKPLLDDSRSNLDWLTERTEVLTEMWTDLTEAYGV